MGNDEEHRFIHVNLYFRSSFQTSIVPASRRTLPLQQASCSPALISSCASRPAFMHLSRTIACLPPSASLRIAFFPPSFLPAKHDRLTAFPPAKIILPLPSSSSLADLPKHQESPSTLSFALVALFTRSRPSHLLPTQKSERLQRHTKLNHRHRLEQILIILIEMRATPNLNASTIGSESMTFVASYLCLLLCLLLLPLPLLLLLILEVSS
jgi:hypothetical protein